MTCLDLTLPAPAENLACDEALLDWAEASGTTGVLRFWEAQTYFVVLGYGNHVRQEVDVAACASQQVPILRRCSGGGTILQGPGCLNYALVLPVPGDGAGPLGSISSTNNFLMERHRGLCSSLTGQTVSVEGVTDLALGKRKFSGNAQRRRRDWILFHGTLLLGLDLKRVSQLLLAPPREPAYRARRDHANFLMHLPLEAASIKQGLRELWQAHCPHPGLPENAVRRLVEQKYGSAEWNLRR